MKTALTDFALQKRGIYGILHVIILLLSLFLVISISVDTFKGIPFYTQSLYMNLYPVPVRLYSRTFFVEGQTALFRHTFSFSIGSYPVSEYYSLYGLDIFAGDYLHAPVHSLGAGRICNGNRSGMADV